MPSGLQMFRDMPRHGFFIEGNEYSIFPFAPFQNHGIAGTQRQFVEIANSNVVGLAIVTRRTGADPDLVPAMDGAPFVTRENRTTINTVGRAKSRRAPPTRLRWPTPVR